MNDQNALTNETRLSEAVSEALQQDKMSAPFNIGVAVQGTTVSLTGDVDSQGAKDRAEQIARSVDGVIGVTNELVVRPTGERGLFGNLAPDDAARSDTDAAPRVPPFAPLGAATGAAGSTAGPQGGAGAAGLAALGAAESETIDDDTGRDNLER